MQRQGNIMNLTKIKSGMVIFVAVACVSSALALTETVAGITWSYWITDDKAYISGSYTYDDDFVPVIVPAISKGTTGAITIPLRLGGYAVAGIGGYAFHDCSGLTSVTIPNSVTSIGDYVFYNCSGLRDVSVSQFVLDRRIDAIFPNNYSITNVSYSSVITNIGDCAFHDCSGLTSVTIPDSVTSIGVSAFNYCRGLRSVTIPNSVTSIGDYAFSGCSGLTNITIPNSVTSIGVSAFYRCSGLTSVTIEGNAPQLEDDYSLFSEANSPCSVYVHKGSTGWGVAIPGLWCGRSIMYIEDAVFSETVGDVPWNYQSAGSGVKLVSADKLSVGELAGGQVSVPETINGKPVTTIGKGLFQGASEVTSVTLPATITEIEPSAFRECSRLEGIELPDGLAEIGDNAFRECVSLRSITIPATVTNIGYFAFRDCLRLETVNLLGDPPRRDLGVFMGVPAFTTISGRLGATTAVIYATVTNSTPEITVPDGWLDEIALAHDTPAGAASYQAAFEAKFGSDLSEALKKPTGKYDLKGNPLYVWQDYVAGTDPLDEEDKFTATITIEGGVPVVKWSPELPAGKAVLRKYTTYGATALGGEWIDVSNLTDAERYAAGYQFFQVSVEMR